MKKVMIVIGMMMASNVFASGTVRLLGGIGPTGVSTARLMGTGNNIETKVTKDKIFGLGYDVDVTDKINVGAQMLSNDTQLLSIGLHI